MWTPIDLPRYEVIRLYQTPLSTLDVAKHFGVSAEKIRRSLKEWGVQRHPPKNLPRPQPNKARKMEANGFWNGGKIVNRSGYEMVKINGHPDSNHLGYVASHRLAMEKKIGRCLTKKEVVHHIDGDQKNNHPDNLQLFSCNADHLRATLKGQCPKWTEEGKEKMRLNGHALGEKSTAILSALKAYARQHSKTPDHFLKSLSIEERHLCRMALELGISEPLNELGRKRETIRRDWHALQSKRNQKRWGRKWGWHS